MNFSHKTEILLKVALEFYFIVYFKFLISLSNVFISTFKHHNSKSSISNFECAPRKKNLKSYLAFMSFHTR